MKVRISADLPTVEKLLAGLTPRECHQPLVRAEQTLAEAEQMLARRRAELLALETKIAELPALVQAGRAKASALTEALREREAGALLLAPAEQAIAKARERVDLETTNATAAVQREVARRSEQLERVAAEVATVCAELRALSVGLARVANPLAVGGFVAVSWPCDATCDVNQRQIAMSSAPAAPSLAWTGNSIKS